MSLPFQLYYITDRSQIKSGNLDGSIDKAIAAGVDWVQIREKDLPTRNLLTLTKKTVSSALAHGHTRVLVNDRLDVALAAAAHGVHLGERSMPWEVARRVAPREVAVGMSCHSLAQALMAQASGANYILLGPIFETPSKLAYGRPLGLAVLQEVTSRVSISVFALGGITPDRAALCRQNGAAGVAGIRLFQDGNSVAEVARRLRENPEKIPDRQPPTA